MTYVMGLAGPGSIGLGTCSNCGWHIPTRAMQAHVDWHDRSDAAKKGWRTRRRRHRAKNRKGIK